MPTPIFSVKSAAGTAQWRTVIGGTDTPFGTSWAAVADTQSPVRKYVPAQRACQVMARQETTIAAPSDGLVLPQGTINVADTTGFPASGTIAVTTGAGQQTVAYTGVTATSFTGCTGGTGTMSTGGAVAASTEVFFGLVGNRIYRSTDQGATAPVAVTGLITSTAAPPTGIGGTQAFGPYPHSLFGPYVAYVNGVPRVWFTFQAGGTVWRFGYSDDLGDTWAFPQVTTGLTSDLYSAHPAVLWRGALNGATTNFSQSFVADPVSLTVSITSRASLVALGDAIMVANVVKDDRLFAVWPDQATNGMRLFEFSGGAWSSILAVDTTRAYSLTQVNNYGGIAFCHPVTGNLWCGLWNNSGGPAPVQGWKLFEVDIQTGTITPWSTSLPAGMQSVGNSSRAVTYLDGLLDPDGNPDIYLCFVPDTSGGSYTTFRVSIGNSPGVSAPVFTNVGGGLPIDVPFPWYPLIGGETAWTSGQRNVTPISRTQIAGGHRYGFRLYSPNPSPDPVKIQILYGDRLEETAANVGTIAKPAGQTWTLMGGPGTWYADGLESADPAAPTFFVDWLCQVDGFAPGDRPKMRMKVYS